MPPPLSSSFDSNPPGGNFSSRDTDAGDSPAKNFGLTPAEFASLVTDLRHGNEALFERVYLAQVAYCMEKLQQFDGLDPQAAYDAAVEGLLQCRDLLLRGKLHYGNLRYLFVTIARQTYWKSRRGQPQQIELTASVPELSDEDLYVDRLREEDYRLLERAFRSLGNSCRELLRRVYYKHQKLQEIADTDGVNYVNLRKQKSRCVQQLRKSYLAGQSPTRP